MAIFWPRMRNAMASPIRRFFVKEFGLGAVSAAIPQGNRVPCYSLERTLVDLVRSRNKGDPDLVPAALKNYVKLKERKIPLLLEYAKAFRVEKIINSYLEVLL